VNNGTSSDVENRKATSDHGTRASYRAFLLQIGQPGLSGLLPLPPGLITADFLLLRAASLNKWNAPTLTPTTNIQTFGEQQVRSVAAVPKQSMGEKDLVCIMRGQGTGLCKTGECSLDSIFRALFIFSR
jgi:hypothetical protein